MGKIEEIVEEVCKEMCDKYCKYSDGVDIDSDKLDEICSNCPLNKLQEVI